jgi:DNA-binding NarL/FixJ family response regulator
VDRELAGLFRDIVEADPERGVVVLTNDRRVLYANGAARTHLKDGSARATDALLPASIGVWIDGYAARAHATRPCPTAEAWYPSDAERRLRMTVDAYPRETGLVYVLRCAPAVPWPEPTVKRLQARFPLTLREAQVATCVARGLTNQEVAQRLGIVEKTVKNVLMSVYEKCRVRNRVELALRAYEAPMAPTSEKSAAPAV